MKVTYDLGDDASICFYLAPRINDDWTGVVGPKMRICQ
jgi:hypothetical protein